MGLHSGRRAGRKQKSNQINQVGAGTENTVRVGRGTHSPQRGQEGTFEMRPAHRVGNTQAKDEEKGDPDKWGKGVAL